MQLVRDWLDTKYKCNWLMIIDNVDDNTVLLQPRNSGKTLLEYIPQGPQGTILYTTRNRDIGVELAATLVSVPPMAIQEAEQLFVEKLGTTSSVEEARELFDELEYLPLAIAQAASYMLKRRQTVAQYLKLYRHGDNTKAKLLNHLFIGHGRESRASESVMTTFRISLYHIKSENPQAANLLSLMSYFDRQGIPKSLLPVEDYDPVDFAEAVGILEAYSLIVTMHEATSYDIHRLVQLAIRTEIASCESGKGQDWACQSLLLLSSRFPDPTYETREKCASYLPHAEKVLQYVSPVL